MTNAQVALIAATAGVNWSPEQALSRADKFKKWLDGQDRADMAKLRGEPS